MIHIAHRGNTHGSDPANENRPEYILDALHRGFEAEVDVWWERGKLYLGHEEPTYEISSEFLLEHSLLWCHAKTPATLDRLLALYVNCFYIEELWMCVLTSTGYIWTSPGYELTSRSIAVMPEYSKWTEAEVRIAAGICTDDFRVWR
jgi:hypothetical protein